ncbi:MAG: hypothetical protein LWW85_09995 [Marinilabiliales bacterium]|nr:hypothetical protein [Marinilabiliales bacterium]
MDKEASEGLDHARQLWKNGEALQALTVLKALEPGDSWEVDFLAGEIHYSLHNWGEAMNGFNRCLRKNGQSQEAENYLILIKNILGFFHTDQFNP